MSRSIFYILSRFPTKIKTYFYKIWNSVKFKLIGVKIGKKSQIKGSVTVIIGVNSQIIIGNNFTFYSGLSINPLNRNIRGCICSYPGAIIKIGNNVGISSASIWAYASSIIIGNNVKIGSDSIIIDSDLHSLDYLTRRNSDNYIISADVIIEDDVWIGTRCIILKGVKIGTRSVIGAGSIVTKDIPADCIAAGNPCRIIRKIANKE